MGILVINEDEYVGCLKKRKLSRDVSQYMKHEKLIIFSHSILKSKPTFMRKILIIPAAVATGVLMFSTSCEKKTPSDSDYKCTCKYKAASGTDTTTTYLYPNLTEGEANTQCLSQEDGVQVVDPSGTCTLSEY